MRNSQNSGRAQPSVVALFSGGGGLDLGFAAAGFDICFATDVDPFSCNTLRINQKKRKMYPKHEVLEEDVSGLNAGAILKKSGLARGEVDVLIGGPPCQSFSVFGQRKGLADTRGGMVWEFHRIVDKLRPRAFVFENVYGIQSVHGGRVLRELRNRLSCHGKYDLSVETYEMAEHGIPQWRKRVFIVGVLGGDAPPRLAKKYGDDESCIPFNTAGQALANMPPPGEVLPNHRMRNHSAKIIKRYEKMPFGQRDNRTRINKLYPDKPSFTIVVGSDQGGGKGHVHPHEPREVTPRESARLQTFPDWWEFDGNVRHMIRQVGNAVPPLFAAQIATHIGVHVFGFPKAMTTRALIKRIGINFLH
ncbi:MAG: DNA cytosine methyltransferase [Gammaproteobacteria bacterium]|nr:DNA cytosine methyltransferase [Gammaproteobacteria bacterium]MDA7961671.1 DNA cytosine methyltransferase [Gammaproteobacteria bacterium]MDA7970085.1 DNA cytosine methyltransferase [Gammaproteobacteria bacterium]MDA7972025.1 DNA cytosine methyltransferase [Gammaproteobacteria bacterium]MDA8024260.1 DNA cytosine methyltransferase [Gammaproteobacteria bacterium]